MLTYWVRSTPSSVYDVPSWADRRDVRRLDDSSGDSKTGGRTRGYSPVITSTLAPRQFRNLPVGRTDGRSQNDGLVLAVDCKLHVAIPLFRTVRREIDRRHGRQVSAGVRFSSVFVHRIRDRKASCAYWRQRPFGRQLFDQYRRHVSERARSRAPSNLVKSLSNGSGSSS